MTSLCGFCLARKAITEVSVTVFTDVARDVAFMRCMVVNVLAIGDRSRWILIDAALSGYGPAIRHAAEARFGAGTRPAAIVLTHGHFDHVGSIENILAAWDVPVYVHRLEMPYLTGRSPYPPPDPLVGRGSLALLSRLYPRGPIDLGGRVRTLPADGTVPDAPGWRWVHTPGHTPGHVSLFRDQDRCLVAGDAVVTTRQESVTAVMTQRPELHGPPAYFTPDWTSARESVCRLAALAPGILAAGHGQPMSGEAMRERLYVLAEHFDELERPRFGRYATQPAIADESGVVLLPPDPLPKVLAGIGAIAATAGLVWTARAAARRRQVAA
jgi:glyoxylase-like metal-dependent hydrolase (beta-lactamase superfamily II)